MSEIAVEEACKSFGPVRAVDGFSVSVGAGELLALVGPSGCGKTTVLRLVAGLEELDRGDNGRGRGEIRIGGKSVVGTRPDERGVAMVFQTGALYPHLSLERNLRLGAGKDVEREAVAEVCRRLGLSELMSRKPHELSGGQRQRAALARALVRRPRALLMDEPLASLDPPARRELRGEIRRIVFELGGESAAIHVTHDQEEAMAIGDRVAVMREGRLEQVGTPAEIYERPVSRFVAEFVGDPMNFVAGEVFGSEAALVGFRPSAVRIGEGPFRLVVDRVEPLGYETRVVGRLVAGASEDGTHVEARFGRASGVDARVGKTLGVIIDPSERHPFGADGRRIGGSA